MVMSEPPRVRHCSYCHEAGHRVDKCPKLVVADNEDPIARAADLREQIDGLQLEIVEYQQVKTTIEKRLEQDRAKLIALERELAKVRAGRV